ncbi:uncharacterized membrane protein (UPF0182 family) [Virgibacillus natechei]|uniref:UPF0182 protein J2Z83_001232 n=2 Tax=Virgibacillus natechei TaxID=1216297 RepID=A0ABS4IGH9_9BACI|nr:UPF0182 family protein [Virgibacillus natechei]MBP1969129.1 uncharacterized membrane protein (UPF0182 family) [Virgibacillus natechei]
MDDKGNMSQQQIEKFKKLGSRFGIIVGILIFLLVVGVIGFQWIVDYIWMDSLDFGNVYTTILGSKVMLGVVGFILFSVVTYFTLFWIRRSYTKHFDSHQLPPIILKRKIMNALLLGVAIIAGALGSLIVQGVGWEPALKLLNYASFGQTDPYFNMDISFYMFVLPFLEFIVYLLLGLGIFFLIVEVGAYSVFNMYRMSRSAQLHMGITLGIIGVLLAFNHLLEPYGTLLTNQVNVFQQSVVHGLSYTDNLINIPSSYILAGVAIIGTVWVIVALVRGKLNSMLIPIVAYVVLVIAGQLVSAGVQNFVVSPNEFSQEEQYLEHNLNFTQAAYDLDNIEERENPGNDSLDEEMIERNELTMDNVRVNDSRPLLDVYNQLQTFRTYYQFNDVDIDRYEIDGEYEQVFIGARELSTEDLPEQAQTWLNQTLRYTHGYGVTMSHVNEITSQGQPEYMLQNVPPEGDLDITRPQIYFGEEDYGNVIVNSEVDEFDYPSGDENMTSRYEEEAGIQLNGMNRLLFSLNEGSFRMLVSDQVTGDSQFLATRNIMDRVNRIAPFFEYDQDPYIFVRDDGSLAWMLDAYLTAESYPYSEGYDGNNNYIRNSVKVTIDAYTGEVDFYIANPDDPLLQTYHNMFPELFTEEIPQDVQAHFRYPERLFTIQASMYGTYHMSDLEVFYNREDVWEFPTELYFDEDIEMEPYYVTMELPEYEEEEFILMMPFTPRNRQNMIAWMGVRNDGEHYGEKFVYNFPKQKNVYGPQQIENRINQDSRISQELNLWAQGGSEVIRGNLLALPIEDTVMYVEPIYIESSNETSLPEVKQVVLAYEDHIVMEETFDQSLEQMLTLIDPETEVDEDQIDEEIEESEEPTGPSIELEEELEEFSGLFNDYQNALSEGNWNEAAEIMTELETKINESE